MVWEGLFNYIEASSGLDQYLMILYGYVGVFLMMTGGRAVAEHVISNNSNETVKTAVEDVYVAVSLVFTVMLWKGNCCFCFCACHSNSSSSVWPY